MLLLVIHSLLLAASAWMHSPARSEWGHLPAGISHWQLGQFDLYRVNPPLVRMVAALPVLPYAPQIVDLQFFDPEQDRTIVWRNLPHWAQARTVCFLTWRMADSLPEDVQQRISCERRRLLLDRGIDPDGASAHVVGYLTWPGISEAG